MQTARVRFIGPLLLLTLICAPGAWAQRFSAWGPPVNLGTPVNTQFEDFQPFISKDGLSLYYVRIERNQPGSPNNIWVAKRATEGDPWGPPARLGPAINATNNNAHPFVTIGGHWLFFNSNRPEGYGRQDLYVSRRHDKREDFPDEPSGGWQEPVNLGPAVNSSGVDQTPWVFEDEGTGVTTLYFNSDRAGTHDIYASTLQSDGTFGLAMPVTELNTPNNVEQHVTISRDGLEMYFISDRPGSTPNASGGRSPDIWVSTRASTSDLWGTPENLDVVNARMGGGPINSPYHDGRPALSFDGTKLYFFSAYRNAGQPGGNQTIYFDIWMTSREKLKGADK